MLSRDGAKVGGAICTFEQEVPLGYLEELQRHHDTWAARYRDAPMLRLGTDVRPGGRSRVLR